MKPLIQCASAYMLMYHSLCVSFSKCWRHLASVSIALMGRKPTRKLVNQVREIYSRTYEVHVLRTCTYPSCLEALFYVLAVLFPLASLGRAHTRSDVRTFITVKCERAVTYLSPCHSSLMSELTSLPSYVYSSAFLAQVGIH